MRSTRPVAGWWRKTAAHHPSETEQPGHHTAEWTLPKAVKEGGAFTHDGYEATAGWTVTDDKMLDIVGIEGMTVINADHGSTDTPLFTFQFVGKGETILATVECAGTELQPGQSTKMDCVGMDSFPTGYRKIRLADMF